MEQMHVTDAGKSGSTLFWSQDRRFIFKTLADIEIEHAKRVFPKYIEVRIIADLPAITDSFRMDSMCWPIRIASLPDILVSFE
jgi:hypothetical protein